MSNLHSIYKAKDKLKRTILLYLICASCQNRAESPSVKEKRLRDFIDSVLKAHAHDNDSGFYYIGAAEHYRELAFSLAAQGKRKLANKCMDTCHYYGVLLQKFGHKPSK